MSTSKIYVFEVIISIFQVFAPKNYAYTLKDTLFEFVPFKMVKVVRRQNFWVHVQPKLRERLAHLICIIMRRVACDASGALQASFV